MSLDQPSRRALLAGTVVAAGGGAYYLARDDGSDDDHDRSLTLHASDETTSFGIDLTGKPIVGSPDAALDIYYWTDFQCPFCEEFERKTLPELVRNHVEPGRVRIVFIPLPYFGSDSMTATVASRCAWAQVCDDDSSAYWNWHAAIFDEQGEKESGWADADALLEYTRSVDSVDADDLETCLEERGDEFESSIEDDAEQARSFGISGTPTFAVFDPEAERAGTLVGAQPPERFDEAIERIQSTDG
ncbi:DsbA family protein [Natronococcus jeotgali]|uniref:DSBA oxidoreductase n=1 Tax=Natronococcus jeotgali DSM 18795 TaxID=1227498 RepID=L9XAV6_9EURY|nr:DsbA family protein [Natronococcus jeotgali]ELY58536.1 DSBA oxidoreductase [Natronococcus jeotgali DSM 18795]